MMTGGAERSGFHSATHNCIPEGVAAVSTTMSAATPEQVLESIVAGINSGDLDRLMPLYESDAAFATEAGALAPGAPGIRDALTGFISMNGTLDLDVTRVLEAG